eukprot:TRINITY_DN29546_c0_g1_i1.p1 TRINITY_DN29546_c0_g1~~TRINITY_DN29546_c0_g1_i1.p1  ORF type:complete len:508 (+),score=67.76 TRINITY_DN29546_c0_g1_i1:43-1566(+)
MAPTLRTVVRMAQLARWHRRSKRVPSTVDPVPACLPAPRWSNRHVGPREWAMTCAQFREFLAACRSTRCWAWARRRRNKQYVDLYDIVFGLVTPWTKGTGCSIALRMNPAVPLLAELMVSHSWGEDLDECLEALESYYCRKQLPSSTPIWFCAFAQYQAGDEKGDVGPTMAEQLQLDPFATVIQSTCHAHGMVVVHTSRAKVYARLWCVFEISEALRINAPVGITYSAAFLNIQDSSSGALLELLRARTSAARCSKPEDEDLIRSKVEEAGGFKQLDWKIFQFRVLSIKEMMSDCPGLAETMQDEVLLAEKVLRKGSFLTLRTVSHTLLFMHWPCLKRVALAASVLLGLALIAVAIVFSVSLDAELASEPLSTSTTTRPAFLQPQSGPNDPSVEHRPASSPKEGWQSCGGQHCSLVLGLSLLGLVGLATLITLCTCCRCRKAPDDDDTDMMDRLQVCKDRFRCGSLCSGLSPKSSLPSVVSPKSNGTLEVASSSSCVQAVAPYIVQL